MRPVQSVTFNRLRFVLLASAGVVGGGLAGLSGGSLYGFVAAMHPNGTGSGAGSILLVLIAICVLVALAGAVGVSLGVAAAIVSNSGWKGHVGGGAFGGLIVGGIVKLLGLDAFSLLLGARLGNVTGALEGAAIGGAVGLGVWMSRSSRIWPAAVAGAMAGGIITALGGQMMAGSLELLSRHFPQSPLKLDAMGRIFGETGFGPVSRIATGALEGGLFAASITTAMLMALHQTSDQPL